MGLPPLFDPILTHLACGRIPKSPYTNRGDIWSVRLKRGDEDGRARGGKGMERYIDEEGNGRGGGLWI